MHPERVRQLTGKMPQIDYINAEQAEQEHGLAPLRRVPPEHADVLDEEGAGIAVKPAKEGVDDLLRGTHGIGELLYAASRSAKPFPLPPDTGAALHPGGRVVIKISQLRKSQETEKHDVAQQHQHEK